MKPFTSKDTSLMKDIEEHTFAFGFGRLEEAIVYGIRNYHKVTEVEAIQIKNLLWSKYQKRQ